jgi:hypothetical protein
LVMNKDQLTPASINLHCSDLEMNIIERAVYGDIKSTVYS